jgi:hypothetical protein
MEINQCRKIGCIARTIDTNRQISGRARDENIFWTYSTISGRSGVIPRRI